MQKNPVRHVKEQIHITDYLDYREYLKQIYLYLKSVKDPYSYLHFAEDLGFSATNVMRLVIVGQRRLSVKSALSIVDALALRNEERRYFLSLVKYTNANKNSKEKFLNELLKLKQTTLPSDVEKVRMEYFSEWHHPIVRELIRVCGGVPSAEWVHSKLYPHLTMEQIEQSVEVLERLKFIELDKKTKQLKIFAEAPVILPADATAGKIAIIRYHNKMLELSREAIASTPDDERDINALTLCVSQQTAQAIKEKIHELCAESLAQEQQEQERELVLQLNVQLFSLTKHTKETKK